MNPMQPQLRLVPSHKRSQVMTLLALQRFKATALRQRNRLAALQIHSGVSQLAGLRLYPSALIPLELQLMPLAEVLCQISHASPDSPLVVSSPSHQLEVVLPACQLPSLALALSLCQSQTTRASHQ